MEKKMGIKLGKDLTFREMLDVASLAGTTIRLGNDFQKVDMMDISAMPGALEYRYKLSNCVIVIIESD